MKAKVVAWALLGWVAAGCDGPVVTVVDAGSPIEIVVEPAAPRYVLGARVRLSTLEPTRWTLEAPSGEREALAESATSIDITLVEEGWSVVTACSASACGHAGLFAAPDDLVIEVVQDDANDARFRVQTASELPIFATAAYDNWQSVAAIVRPGEWQELPLGYGMTRYELSATTATQQTHLGIDLLSRYEGDDESPGGLSSLARTPSDADCDPLTEMFGGVLSTLTFDRYTDGAMSLEVLSVEPSDTCGYLRLTGMTSGVTPGGYDAGGTFHIELGGAPPSWQGLLVTSNTDGTGFDIEGLIRSTLLDQVRGVWRRFVEVAVAPLAAPIRSPGGVTVTPAVGTCQSLGCTSARLYVPGRHLNVRSQLACGRSESAAIAVSPEYYNALLSTWWESYREAFDLSALRLVRFDLPPAIVADRRADDSPMLVLPALGVEVEGSLVGGRIEQPLRVAPDAVGFEAVGASTVYLDDNRRISGPESSATRPIYEAFIAVLEAVYRDLQPFLQLPAFDSFAPWADAFPGAGLDGYTLIREPCPTEEYCPTTCGRWARIP